MIINLQRNRPSIDRNLNDICQYGKDLLRRKLQQNAIEIFDSIIEQSDREELDSYNTQYAYFGKMSAYNGLLANEYNYIMTKKQIRDYQKELLKISNKVLELLKKHPHLQDVAPFKYLQMEMVQVATRNISELKSGNK